MAIINRIFEPGTGRSMVEAFVARVTLSMAKGVQQSVLLRRSWDLRLEQTWSLASIVVLWYSERLPASGRDPIRQVFKDVSIGPINMALVPVQDKLTPFVRTAYEARSVPDLAKAGGYFVSLMEWLGLEVLRQMLDADQVQAVVRQVKSRLPAPQDLKGPYEEALGIGPQSEPTAPPADGRPVRSSPGTRVRNPRAEKFDRADLVRSPPTAREEPPPQLESSERLVAVLYTRGWKPEDIERITKGPKGG